MLLVPNCWIQSESLLFNGVALLKLPFKLLFERRRLLVSGLDPTPFSCPATAWLGTFFSCDAKASSPHIRRISRRAGVIASSCSFSVPDIFSGCRDNKIISA
ncbi:hypothetical protein NC652_009500 [Populus alba x Populus x berolinensis]|nr:hypothetical protein NC652_009500 [Populus alba x Populus x berolinensis]